MNQCSQKVYSSCNERLPPWGHNIKYRSFERYFLVWIKTIWFIFRTYSKKQNICCIMFRMNTFNVVLNYEDASDAEALTMAVREAARCVIFDKDGNVALIHFSVHDFYKVPGGGIDEGEGVLDALKRECLEEAGVHIEGITPIGTVTEIKKEQQKKQISYCYNACVAGEKMEPAMTEEESGAGALLHWMPLAQAIQKLEKSGFKNLSGRYIYQRELVMLNACV